MVPELDKNDDGTAWWYRTLLNAGKFFPRFSGSTGESLVGTRVRHGPVIAGEKAQPGTVRSRFVGVPSMYYIEANMCMLQFLMKFFIVII